MLQSARVSALGVNRARSGPSARTRSASKPVAPGQIWKVTQPSCGNQHLLATREYQRRMKAVWRVKSEKLCKAMTYQLNSPACRGHPSLQATIIRNYGQQARSQPTGAHHGKRSTIPEDGQETQKRHIATQNSFAGRCAPHRRHRGACARQT